MAKNKEIPQELATKLKEIDSWLFYGDKKKVAKRVGKRADYVGKVIAGELINPQIIDVAIEVMNENKARFEIKPKMKVA
jgi:hypothetical protein